MIPSLKINPFVPKIPELVKYRERYINRSLSNKTMQRLMFNAERYVFAVMIKNFKCKHTQALYEGKSPKQFRVFQVQAERKLQMLDSAAELLDLRSPAGNKLKKLGGDRQGQHSIRINKQWRVCFVWSGEPYDVEIADYHYEE